MWCVTGVGAGIAISTETYIIKTNLAVTIITWVEDAIFLKQSLLLKRWESVIVPANLIS